MRQQKRLIEEISVPEVTATEEAPAEAAAEAPQQTEKKKKKKQKKAVGDAEAMAATEALLADVLQEAAGQPQLQPEGTAAEPPKKKKKKDKKAAEAVEFTAILPASPAADGTAKKVWQ